MKKSEQNVFLTSALTLENSFHTSEEILSWVEERRMQVDNNITLVEFSELNNWTLNRINGDLEHDTGNFFSITGIDIETNWGNITNWSQPVINQPEIGFLGIITKKFNNVLHFLMQAKIEPGNINAVQISPTLQATKSNYMKLHKGSAPHYLEYFIDSRNDVKILLDQLQSEQGARFLKKRNRNIIIEVTGDVHIKEDFCWMTLGQIKNLMNYDNLINMDTRTVISCIQFGKEFKEKQESNDFGWALLRSELIHLNSLHTIENIISWITRLKTFAELRVTQIHLNSLTKWVTTEKSIHHIDHKYFSVIAVNVAIQNREVKEWMQPLIKSTQEGVIAYVIKKINGTYHFLVQAKLEAGNFDILELAPTVQCLTGNYRKGENEYEVPYLDLVLKPEEYGAQIRYSTYQSEEGGRFYKEQNKNLIVEVDDNFDHQLPEKYIWMTLGQMKTFIQFNNYFNIQARSLIAALNYL